jgi:NifU-like protein involved in Fe-S cluster formation
MSMNYNSLTWRHFENPSHAGRLSGGRVRRAAAGSRAQGTWVQFDLRLGAGDPQAADRTAILEAVRFLAYACPHIIAVADWIAQEGTGRPARPALPESVQALRRRFEVPIEKLGGLLIVEDAWIAAISSPDRE